LAFELPELAASLSRELVWFFLIHGTCSMVDVPYTM
jgi:hypothetical protein